MPPIQLLTNDFSWNIGSDSNRLKNLYNDTPVINSNNLSILKETPFICYKR